MLRLMIADDEQVIRETICTLIDWQALDIKVVAVCKNGLEICDAIMDEYPDIVLTDIKMPGMNGVELIRHVHGLDKNVRFVVLSGYNEFEYAAEVMRYGVRHYLLKPCNETKIIEAILDVKAEIEKEHGNTPKLEEPAHKYNQFVEKTIAYVNQHLSDSNLSLKWIAENYLYMNVDYVSKQFCKQTGQKFSDFLNQTRIKKAKELIESHDVEKMYLVAEEVGLGAHPQYFSQLFKKYTGATPSAYYKSLQQKKSSP